MRKWIIAIVLFSAGCKSSETGTETKSETENLIIITTDGLRWQEVFKGMDTAIAMNKKFNQGDSAYLFENFWSDDVNERRKKLMPFLWKTVLDEGQIYGNRELGNKVDNANPFWFSYPGYNEIMTGFADTTIKSNEYKANPNITVLEFLNQQSGIKGKVAAFGAWDAFDRILNEQRSGIPVFSAFDSIGGNNPSASEKLINAMMNDSHKPWLKVESFDVFTHYAAIEYLKTKKPKVLYIAYGETDEWAHAGQYRSYLEAGRQVDAWLKEIWNFVQKDSQYRNKTTLLFTTDHGRGDVKKEEWTSHNKKIEDSHEMWFAVMGPGINARGEVKEAMQLYQKQFAQTMAKILGYTYQANHPIAEAIKSVIDK